MNKEGYLRVLDDADRWADGHVVTKALRPYVTRVPRDTFSERTDRVFWLGEVYDDIRYAFESDPEVSRKEQSELDAVLDMRTDRRVRTRGNPPSSSGRAVSKYLEFHSQEPRKVGAFHRDLVIPDRAVYVGDAIDVLYRSDKLNPTTGEDEGWIDYIHDHDAGVRVYRTDHQAADGSNASLRVVPAWLRNQKELTWLGDCLGFSYTDHEGHEVKAKGTGTLPELYTIPSGKALLVIQGKRRLLAMMWGGRLGVEQRGIVH